MCCSEGQVENMSFSVCVIDLWLNIDLLSMLLLYVFQNQLNQAQASTLSSCLIETEAIKVLTMLLYERPNHISAHTRTHTHTLLPPFLNTKSNLYQTTPVMLVSGALWLSGGHAC
jgi:hypothetical protein